MAPRGRPFTSGLYIVSTPIGHADDITLRALDCLDAADLIVCEDTRVTARLLALYQITTPLMAYHDHNGARMRPRILEALEAGRIVAQVSDAGTPLISDPGYRLVGAALEAGHSVTPIPGPSAALAGLVISGLPTDRFLFAGFVPVKPGARKRFLEPLAPLDATLIFFETGPRLSASLEAMREVFGPRPAAVTRELTKTFEEARRDTLDRLAAAYADAPAPKGEIVVFVGPAPADAGTSAEELDGILLDLLDTLGVKEAVAQATARTGLPRRQVYQRALALKDQEPSEEDDG